MEKNEYYNNQIVLSKTFWKCLVKQINFGCGLSVIFELLHRDLVSCCCVLQGSLCDIYDKKKIIVIFHEEI